MGGDKIVWVGEGHSSSLKNPFQELQNGNLL